MSEEIKNYISLFFQGLEIDLNDFTVMIENNSIIIKIQTKEFWLLIWSHGKTFESILSLLNQIINNKNQEIRYKIKLEINDYKGTRDDRLFSFIQSKIIEVQNTWIECKLPFYSAYERKKIHNFISEIQDKNISTQSRWKDNERRIFIYKKEKKLTIDIDGNDI